MARPRITDADRKRFAESIGCSRCLAPEALAGRMDWHWLIMLLAEHREEALRERET